MASGTQNGSRKPGASAGETSGFPLREEALDYEEVGAASPPPPRGRTDPRSPWPWVLAVVLLALAGLGSAYAYTHRAGTHRHPPSGPLAQRASASARTDPEPATLSTAAVTPAVSRKASSRGALISVPNVVHEPFGRAIASLRRVGVAARIVHVDSSLPEGEVVGQRPSAGTKVRKSGAVELKISQPAPVTVPDVAGTSLSVAVRTLGQRHLLASIRRVPNRLPTGTVVAESPAAGTRLKREAHVFVTVSRGGKPTTHPAPHHGSGPAPPPPPAAESSGPSTITVPDVIGEDALSATSDLESAEFTVDEVDVPTSDVGQDGIVLDQDPAGGSDADQGTTVTISVGHYSSS